MRGAPSSEIDGEWVLCSPKGATADWLDALTINGGLAVDGNGDTCRLERSADGRLWLFGGRLRRKGAVLVRSGKSGAVQVYMRRASLPYAGTPDPSSQSLPQTDRYARDA